MLKNSNPRKSGILLHISSLPGKYGIGSFGKESYDFIDFLRDSKQKLWQILPLVPTGLCNSPYKGLSAFALNPLFADLEALASRKLISLEDLQTIRYPESYRISFETVRRNILPLIYKASEQFLICRNSEDIVEFDNFKQSNQFWLDFYAQFMALSDYYAGKPWSLWEEELKARNGEVFLNKIEELKDEIEKYRAMQFILYQQWNQVKKYANDREILIIGDLPLYVDYNSVDVWAHPNYFKLDAELNPVFVSGVPPDYFCETGQLWGNPVYNWEYISQHDFLWWHQRLFNNCSLFDLVRIDHFRGLAAFWAVSAKAIDAINGQWISALGEELFNEFYKKYNTMPFIAEDLGFITDEVINLRDKFKLPGMKILQFAFDSEDNHEFLPHHHINNCVVYTGTHDNSTIRGWFMCSSYKTKNYFIEYGNFSNDLDPSWAMIGMAWSSVADYAITTMQDILSLDDNARLNTPGTSENNWTWKTVTSDFSNEIKLKLLKITNLYDRN